MNVVLLFLKNPETVASLFTSMCIIKINQDANFLCVIKINSYNI